MAQPTYSPLGGIGSISKDGQYTYTAKGWVPNTPTPKPAAAPVSVKTETPAAVLPKIAPEAPTAAVEGATDLGNLRMALRSAMTEAAQQTTKSRITSLSGIMEGGASPTVINAALGLAQQGLAKTSENVVSDVVSAFQDQLKAVQFNPDQYRTVQGGIYDIKNNAWIVNPKADGGGSSGSKKQITRTDAQKMGLPVSLVGTTWGSLQEQLDSTTAPQWFREMTQSKLGQSMLPEKLNQLWQQFVSQFNSDFADSGAIDFNDL